MGWKSDYDIDAIFIIDGEEVENDGEWKGLTQTMNKNFKEQIGLVKTDINNKVALVNDKVALVKQDVQLVKEDIMQELKLVQEATKAQFD